MLPQMGRGPEPNLGIGEITVRLANLAHGFARERVLEVDHHSRLLDLNDLLLLCSRFTR